MGLPNLPFLPLVLPLTIVGMLLVIPWIRHQKKRWLWAVWLALPVAVIVLTAVEAGIARSLS
jgi:hypothetical protein